MTDSMNVLIVGGGGREHALAWKAAQSPRADKVYVAPGNAGTADETGVENVAIGAEDIDALLDFARDRHIGLTIVGPEAPLVAGIVDRFSEAGLIIFGPDAGAAQLEGSKTFSKDFLVTRFRPPPTRALPISMRRAALRASSVSRLSSRPTGWLPARA